MGLSLLSEIMVGESLEIRWSNIDGKEAAKKDRAKVVLGAASGVDLHRRSSCGSADASF